MTGDIRANRSAAEDVALAPIVTLVTWVGFVAVALIGQHAFVGPTASAPSTQPAADVKLIDVAIANLPAVASAAASLENPAPYQRIDASESPPAPPVAIVPEIPAMPSLTDVPQAPAMVGLLPKPNEFSNPSSQPVAMSAPVTPATRSASPTNLAAPANPRIQHLGIYGQSGSATEPAPEYPLECVIAHQEGTVVVQFHVDDAGRVSQAQVETPSRWPLLNQAAARSVRQTWSFPPGKPGNFDVSIQYKLSPPS
jgi:TonB family protein